MRILDVGCGRGTPAWCDPHAEIIGIDINERSLSEASRRHPKRKFIKARAEALPFRDGWFERVVFWLSAHLVDRAVAFAEAGRVLVADGRIAVVTFDESHFATHWLNRFFPSMERIDRARFPTRDQLAGELPGAHFVRISQTARFTREEALERVHCGHISTFDLLDPDELRQGTTRAERELPEQIESPVEFLVAVTGTM